MSLFRLASSRKYLGKIYLWVAMAIFIVVIVFAGAVYINVEKTVQESNYENNRQVLSQMEYNIDYMDEIVKNLCLSIYFNPDVIYLMNTVEADQDYYTNILKVDTLKKSVLDINAFIHSIYIYNFKSKSFYSTYNGINFQDRSLKEALGSYPITPLRTPISRKIEGNSSDSRDKPQNVFTYAMYESLDGQKQPEGAVYINVKSQWVMDNIKKVSNSSQGKQDQIFLLSDKREFIDEAGPNDSFYGPLKEIFHERVEAAIKGGKQFDLFSSRIQGKPYFITYAYVEKTDWVILKVQSQLDVYKYIDKLKTSIVLSTLVLLVIAVFIAATVSSRIYKPIGNLVKQVNAVQNAKGYVLEGKDEIGLLQEYYKHSSEQMQISLKERNTNRDILKTYYLRKLILDSSAMTQEDIQKACEQGNLNLDLRQPMVVAYIRIDNYEEFNEKYSEQDKELIKFAVCNIMSEVVARRHKNECADMKNDQLAMLINADAPATDYYEQLAVLVKEAQEYILEYFKIAVTVAISRKTNGIREITGEYNYSANASLYRYIFGRMSVIVPSMIRINLENMQFDYSFTQERKLVEEIKCGNLQNAEEVLLSILGGMTRLNHYNIMLSVMHLMHTVRCTVHELNQSRLDPVSIDFTHLNNRVMEFETIDELYIAILGVLKQVMVGNKSEANEKHAALVEAVKELVGVNFTDPGLCLAGIGQVLKMSPSYIGRLFKENTGTSVADYINEVRIQKAAEWLRNSNMGIGQIMGKVGIENESHFYKHFKKRFGTTPKEYALKKAVEEL